MKKFFVFLSLVLVLSGGACGRFKGEKGDSGLNGADGYNGVDGEDGQNGKDGADGKNGKDGTTVTMVKFCPGTPTYPTVFVEYAFCIDGKLYATYSANGGFTAYLPNGRYHSEGIGSRCDFTVTSCTITP